MRSILIALVLAATASRLAADDAGLPSGGGIQVQGAFLLLENGPGGGIQGTPYVAYGQGVYLAVWREGWHGKGGQACVYAARVSPQGNVLDPKGIEIVLRRQRVEERPRVAFGGGVFLVVWQDFSGKDYDVLAARVNAEGKVLDREPIAVAAGPRTQVLPEVASDGQGFLVVWQGLQGNETSYRGFAAPVGADGNVGATIETGASPQPKIAWNGERYLAAYGSQSVVTVMLDREGRPLNRSKWGTPGLYSTKAAVFSLSPVPGKGWLVVGHRAPPDPWGWGGPGAMRAALVGADGRVENQDAIKEPAGVQRRLPGWLDLGREKRPGSTWPWGESASAWTGRCSLVVWQRQHLTGEKLTNFENCDLVAARLDGFRSLDEAGVPVAASPAEEKRPALASDGAGHALCLYEKHASGATRIAARLMTVR